MNILLLGGGGREHALAWKLRQSPRCGQLFTAPGNAGTAALGVNLDLDPNDFPAVRRAVLDHAAGLVVVGPEEPLVRGIYDFFRADEHLRDVPIIAPSQAGARLEGSKAYAKQFMEACGIPTARYREFTPATLDEGLRYLAQQPPPYVLKADGLAAGKGVLILHDMAEAQHELRAMLDGKFGEASRRVVIEQFLDGIEFSVFALTDGRRYRILPVAKDYKRVGEGDTGLNTGGMGSVSPVPFADPALMDKVERRIIAPTVAGLQARGIAYTGFLFFGLINVNGDPCVIEYNCRLGDPETQVVLPRLRNDLVELCLAAAAGRLDEVTIEEDPRSAAAVILVAGGYPGSYRKGDVISGLDEAGDCLLFHAGTRRRDDGSVVTNGGRVLAVTSYGTTMAEALAAAKRDAARVDFAGKYYRRDIGFDLKS